MKTVVSFTLLSSVLIVSGIPLDGNGGQATTASDPSATSSMDTASSIVKAASTMEPAPAASSSAKSTIGTTSAHSVSPLAAAGVKLALDPQNGTMVGYDSQGKPIANLNATAESHKVLASTTNTCRAATENDFNVPGWSAWNDRVHAWANQTPDKYFVNNTDPSGELMVCYPPDTVKLSVNGNPQCSTTTAVTQGSAEGTSLTMTTQLKKGMSWSYTTTTEQSSTFSWSDTISITAGLPGIADVSDSQTFGVDVTNSKGTESSSKLDSTITTTGTYTNPTGKSCNFVQNVTECNYQATGTINLFLTGYVWMEFKNWFRDPACAQSLTASGAACAGKKSKDLNNCYNSNGCAEHIHWGIPIEEYLPNIPDRSNPLQFSDAFISNDLSDYRVQCN